MEFSSQQYWSGLSFPSSGDLPDPGIEPRSPALGSAGGTSGKEPAYQRRRHKRCGFNPWVGKMPWRRKQVDYLPSEPQGRNINNFRYADDTTFMAGNQEELKSLLMKMKEESEKGSLKLNIQKTKIMASGPITSWQIDGERMETITDFYLLGLQNHCRWWL